MKDWEKAEKIVKQMSGGQATPGSGSKGVRGDITTNSHRIEVKQTDNKMSITILSSWFSTLEKLHETTSLESLLCIFFQLNGYCYILDRNRKTEEWKKWSSLKVYCDTLPSQITTKNYVWVLEPLTYLRTLSKKEETK